MMSMVLWALAVYHLRLAMEAGLSEPRKGHVPVTSDVAALVLETLLLPEMRGPFESLFADKKEER